MKYKTVLVCFAITLVIGSASAGILQRGTGFVSWDDHYQWDKKHLDSPPRVVGGHKAFANFLGAEFVHRPVHSLFFVEMHLWGPILAIIALFLLIQELVK